MEAVETGRHIEGRRIDVIGKAKCSVAVLVHLQSKEDNAKPHGKGKPLYQVLFLAFKTAVMRPRQGTARQKQDQGVEERQVPRIKNFDTSRWPFGHTGAKDHKRVVEEGPEEGDKEHHLGCDEQRHAIAQADLNDLVMVNL